MSRPRVLVNFAPSLDGKIAPAHKTRPFVMSREQEDPKRMKALRERADAVIIGATNLRADDPDLAPARLRVVVTRAGEGVRPEARMFDRTRGGEAVVAHTTYMTPETRDALGTRATLLELGTSQVDVGALLGWRSRASAGAASSCARGQRADAAQFFAARAVGRGSTCTLVPRILGGSSAPTMVEGDGFEPDAIPFARLVQHDRVGDELYLAYAFDWPASPAQ